MMWRGLKKPNRKEYIRRLRNRQKNKLIRDGFNLKKNEPHFLNIYTGFHLPDRWSVVGIYSRHSEALSFYMFDSTYRAYLPAPGRIALTHYDANSRTAVVSPAYGGRYAESFNSYFNYVFRALNVPSLIKLKFRGKGYYIYKNKRNTVTPQFNYAHRIYMYSPFVNLKFLTKTSIIIFGFSVPDLKTAATNIYIRRPINIYTGRGVRFTRQVIYKKTGKVSSYR